VYIITPTQMRARKQYEKHEQRKRVTKFVQHLCESACASLMIRLRN